MAVHLVPCPKCKKLARYEGNPDRPFCSERCKLLDLGAWASEDYRIQGKGSEVEESNLSQETSFGSDSEDSSP